jgi:hypothetical protein
LFSLAYTTTSLVEREVTEIRGGVLGWFQKPRTVNRREEVRQRVERGEWHGSEIGEHHKFLSSECWASQASEWIGGGGVLQ